MTAISQLQMTYSAEEDRILLRVNTDDDEEFRFWLTRRFALLLMRALEAHRAADPDIASQVTEPARQAVEAFKEQAANARGNFDDAFKPSHEFPLGEAPVLAYKLIYRVEDGHLKFAIEPRSGKGIRLVLNAQLNFNVTRLLQSACEKGEWGLAGEQGKQQESESRVIN
jgi:hypothetical protein